MRNPRKLTHEAGDVWISDLDDGVRQVRVTIHDTTTYVPKACCTTRYPDDLIAQVLRLRGPAWLCDEIRRDESPTYLPHLLSRSMLPFVDASQFRGKRLLDFGCGAGASTVVLARMFPDTEIVGIDLNEQMLDLARARARFYGFSTIRFLLSPGEQELPTDIGMFDYISFSAVYEHMLPDERQVLMPKIWALLKPGGVLFVNQTPNRFFPMEPHTTGLPLLNYLPDRIALAAARRFSKRIRRYETWEPLLRRGVRGGTEKDILRSLGTSNGQHPALLKPNSSAFSQSAVRHSLPHRAKHVVYGGIGAVLGTSFGPWIRMAIRKHP